MPAGLWVVLLCVPSRASGAELGFKAVILPLSAGGAGYCVRM